MDSFSILGVAPGASAAEIKRAYRRLAMVWHPDRNHHPEAADRFRQIRAAYERLQPRSPAEAWTAPYREAPVRRRAPDIRLDMELTLEEAAFGCKKEVILSAGKPCAACGGKGETAFGHSRMCAACHGSGRLRAAGSGLEQCGECGGRGFRRDHRCPECAGTGLVGEPEGLRVPVPPGLRPGEKLRVSGKGEPGRGDQEAGDLYLQVSIAPHPLFRLEGMDLVLSMPVNGLTLLAGGAIEVPALAGKETVDIAPGGLAERTVRVAGKGFPGRDSPSGDLVIHLQAVLPDRLDAESRRLLQAAAAACEARADECLPEIAAWRQRHGV